MNERIKQKIVNLGRSLNRLQEALSESCEENKLAIDATIQRFKFCYELFWKTLKVKLEQEGIIANTPKEILQAAFRVQWIKNETLWLEMMQDRNTTSHVYNEKIAFEIYQRIKNYFTEMKKIYGQLWRGSRIKN